MQVIYSFINLLGYNAYAVLMAILIVVFLLLTVRALFCLIAGRGFV